MAKKSSKLDIFQYNDWPTACSGLRSYMAQKSSIRSCARKLGYKSPSILSMVLSQQRMPSAALLQKISTLCNWGPAEKSYAENLVNSYQKPHIPISNPFSEKETKRLSLTQFKLIAEWHYLALFELLKIPTIDHSPRAIAKALRKKITDFQAKSALKTLADLGVIDRDGNRWRVLTRGLKVGDDVPSSAIRKHHESMLQRAFEAMHEQHVDVRSLVSTTFTMRGDKIADAVAELDIIREMFRTKYADPQGDGVFQFNLQFFEHTARGTHLKK